ncbi:hypothetical protein BXZ70DRAFT_584084 [Cristinia sonorae]|uniref:F-box domain-containing protein n=1 Tax=Cristinia sonorae TaxID=1940300 RepID=A0A8K0UGX5_9AGAR|nr:hypothetical protein BXZ70DRAFT_584084 [Cristinia sonorae]
MAVPGVSFSDLTDDCILHLFKKAHIRDIISFRQISKRLYYLSHSHACWVGVLERLADDGALPYLSSEALNASAHELEEFATRYFRIKSRIHRKTVGVQWLQEHRWTSPPIRDTSQLPVAHQLHMWPNRTYQEEFYRTGAWISPGFLIVGSLVRPRASEPEYGFVSMWNLGHGVTSIVPGGLPVVDYKIPSLPGAASELATSKFPLPDEKNTYLVLTGTWTRTSWALLKMKLPYKSQEAECSEIAAFTLPRSARKTALDIHEDLIVILSDAAESLPSFLLLNWREATCVRFKVYSIHDQQRATALSREDGRGPVLIAWPYIVYIRSHTFSIHVTPILSFEHFEPLASYDLNAVPTVSIPSWSADLPWKASSSANFSLSTMKDGTAIGANSDGEITVNIDFCKSDFTGSAKLVISKGRMERELRRGSKVTFNYKVEIRDIIGTSTGNDLHLGVASINGSVGRLSPHELEILLRRVLRVRHGTDPFLNRDPSEDRRIPVSRSSIESRVSLDPVLGRLCILPDGHPGLYLVDVST